MRFHNQVVMVTGAAGTLGTAVAAAFKAEGGTVVAVDLDQTRLDAAYPDAPDLPLACDLGDAAAVVTLVEKVKAKLGRIDALINVAGGFAMGTPVHATPAEIWEQMFAINLHTMRHACEAVVPVMQAAGRGRIVNIGAIGALVGGARLGAYVASKSAVIRLTESMAEELKREGINVNCVLPSVIDTPPNRQAMPDADPADWVNPASLAGVIAFLCSEDAAAIHGASIPVRGLS